MMNSNLIISDPKIMMGKPIIKGTRLTVELILEKVAAGETVDQLLEAHPRLTREGIQAALAYQTNENFIALPRKLDETFNGPRKS